MKAITLYPEWAWAIVHLDKRTENRTWAAWRDLQGHRIGIHAGRAFGGKVSRPLAGRELVEAFETSGVLDMARRAGWDVSLEEFEDLGPGVLVRFEKDVFAFGPQRVELRAEDVHRGALVGSSVYEGAHRNDPGSERRWGVPGQLGWSLSHVLRLREPATVRGAQGLWEVPPELADRLCKVDHNVHPFAARGA